MDEQGRIIVNQARCTKCQDLIISAHRHDMRWCSCGAIAVDGGNEYLKRVGDLDAYDELSILELPDGRRVHCEFEAPRKKAMKVFTEFKRLTEVAEEISRRLDSKIEIDFTWRNMIRNSSNEARTLIERLERNE